jgi:alkanesulfonate monooxygenase SsuD/methylene tetrahydromethanopterin reductase-like flavin-dependent oxidoreductase (luciferase family)
VNLRSGRPSQLPPPVDGFAERLHPADKAMLDTSLSCAAVGSPDTVRRALQAFIERTGADELMLTSQIFDHQARLRSYEITSALRAQL